MGASEQIGVHRQDLANDPRWQLVERIVASPAFQRSARLREFLLYVTERMIQRHASELTEQHIGHALFGKPADYTPLEDSSVRVHARQLRLKLHEYFDGEGRSEPLIVEIPKGSYAPVFRPAAGLSPVLPAPSAPARWRAPRVPTPWALVGLLTIACVILWLRPNAAQKAAPSQPAADIPWPFSQVFDGRHRTRIVVADSNYGMLRILSQKPGSLEEYLRPDYPESFKPPKLTGQESRIMGYIASSLLTSYADIAVLTALLNMAGPARQLVSVRSARDLRLRELEEGNYVFLGSPGSNPWVSLFESRLNFCETEGVVGEGGKAFLNKKPLKGEQQTYTGLKWTGTAGEDYAAIALLPNEAHQGNVLILQGLQQEGTEAAGLFLADEENRHKLREALGIRSGEELASFEALIRTKAVAGAPNTTTLVATRIIH